MSFATDEEIRIAHNILLKDNKPFDNARMKIIKEDSSCYVQACPGSGKTTTLLAKLIILANRLPMADGKGVCVLTHTNVAIDEIKAKSALRPMSYLIILIFLEQSKPFCINMSQLPHFIISMEARFNMWITI